MTSSSSSSGSLLGTYTFQDLQTTTWDDGGYTNVTIINEAIDVVPLITALPVPNIIQGSGIDVTPQPVAARLAVLPPLVETNVSVNTNSISSTVSLNAVTVEIRALIEPEPIALLSEFKSSSVSANVNIYPLYIGVRLNFNTPIIPTWRLPYVGCDEWSLPSEEELVILSFNEDTYTLTSPEEVVLLNIDC